MSDKIKHLPLLSCLLTIHSGAVRGSIKSQPIIEMSPEAENAEMLSLQEYIERALTEAGVKFTKLEKALTRKRKPSKPVPPS